VYECLAQSHDSVARRPRHEGSVLKFSGTLTVVHLGAATPQESNNFCFLCVNVRPAREKRTISNMFFVSPAFASVLAGGKSMDLPPACIEYWKYPQLRECHRKQSVCTGPGGLPL
jgi:hypothetical protein